MAATNIEWADRSWNPVVGCSIVSPGCTNCYAMAMAHRINQMTLSSHYEGMTKRVNGRAVWTGTVALAPDHILTAPLRWKKPCRIFVNSMGDLFHESVPDEWIARIFNVMEQCHHHIFQVLTKRSSRMHRILTGPKRHDLWNARMWHKRSVPVLTNVHLGVSCEDQERADERIPDLLATPAAVRFVSAEPLLGPINFRHRLDWIICGGESGPGARPMHVEWARSIRERCKVAGVPFFMKQLGAHVIQDGERITLRDRKGADMSEWPHDLRVQEFPR